MTHRMLTIAAVLLGVALAAPPAGRAGEAQDQLFAVGVLDEVPTGIRLVFAHERGGSFDAALLPVIEGGEIEVALSEGERGREAQVTLREAGHDRPVASFPARAGHPLLLFFLETTARNVATLTGGSPFYIRNRMREALGAQDSTEPVEIVVAGSRFAGERMVFRPLAEDPNRDRLGAFADLEIHVTVSEGVAGQFASFTAISGPGPDGHPVYTEGIVFERVEEE